MQQQKKVKKSHLTSVGDKDRKRFVEAKGSLREEMTHCCTKMPLGFCWKGQSSRNLTRKPPLLPFKEIWKVLRGMHETEAPNLVKRHQQAPRLSPLCPRSRATGSQRETWRMAMPGRRQAFSTTPNATDRSLYSSLEGGGATRKLPIAARSHLKLCKAQMLSSLDFKPVHQGGQFAPITHTPELCHFSPDSTMRAWPWSGNTHMHTTCTRALFPDHRLQMERPAKAMGEADLAAINGDKMSGYPACGKSHSQSR